MRLGDITPYHKNAKKHPTKQVRQIADSIKAFGFRQPIVVDKDNVIIVGHGRYEAAKLLKLDDVPVEVANDLTPAQVQAYRLADNKLNESEWDMGLAVDELKELSPELFDLTGFDRDLLIEPDAKDDVIPEDAPTVAKLGDIWQLGRHRVMCGDSTQREAVLALTGGILADMVFTDPPYNVDYTGKTKDALKIQNDRKGDGAFYDFLLAAFTCMALSTKRGGSAYITHADSEGLNFRQAFKDAGFLLKQCIIWNKNSMVMGRQDYHWKHEPILYGWQDGDAHKWYGPRNQTTVWDVQRPARSAEHPTMKPVELITNALTNSSKLDDVVLDLFLGSGSTLIACEKTGRICYGMELDPKYVDVIIKRWEDYTGQKAVKTAN